MLNKYNLTFIILIACLSVMFADYTVNGYSARFSLESNTSTNIPTQNTNSTNTDTIKQKTTSNILINKELLSKSELSDFSISDILLTDKFFTVFPLDKDQFKIYKYSIGQDNKTALRFYEIRPKTKKTTESYYEIKNKIQSIIKTADNLSINTTNTYGQSSFFLNDNKRDHLVFLVVMFKTRIMGFEYPKDNHNIVEKIISELKQI